MELLLIDSCGAQAPVSAAEFRQRNWSKPESSDPVQVSQFLFF